MLVKCLFLAAAANAAITRYICGDLVVNTTRPNSVVCAYRGSLRDEAANPPYLDVNGGSFQQCRDSCVTSTKCKSWAYTGQTLRCRTFRKNIGVNLLQSNDNTTGTFFWNVRCFQKPNFRPISELPGDGTFSRGVDVRADPDWITLEDEDPRYGRAAQINLACDTAVGPCGSKRFIYAIPALCPNTSYIFSYDIKFPVATNTASTRQIVYAGIIRGGGDVPGLIGGTFLAPQRNIVAYSSGPNVIDGQIPVGSWFRYSSKPGVYQQNDELSLVMTNTLDKSNWTARVDNIQLRPAGLNVFDT